MNIFNNLFGGSSAAANQAAANQSGLANQQSNMSQNLQGSPGQLITSGLTANPTWSNLSPYILSGSNYPTMLSSLDIDAREKHLKELNEVHSKYKAQLDLINNLSSKTKDILRIVKDINNIEDYIKLDKYVREQLFNASINDFIDNEPKGS